MGKGGKSQTIGYKYHLGMHQVLCHGPIDAILRAKVHDRQAWIGHSSGGRITVDAPDLFGGSDREGGVSGEIDIEMGEPTQLQNDYLVSQLGSTVPAYRGVVAAVLRQCYLGNNPYLKPWGWRGQRIFVRQNGIAQWYVAKAAVPDLSGATLAYPYSEELAPAVFISPFFTADGKQLVTAGGTTYMRWSLDQGEPKLVATAVLSPGVAWPCAVAPDALYGYGGDFNREIFRIEVDGTQVLIVDNADNAYLFPGGLAYAGGIVWQMPPTQNELNIGKVEGAYGLAITCDYNPTQVFTDTDGQAVAVGRKNATNGIYVDVGVTGLGTFIVTSNSEYVYGFATDTHYLLYQDGTIYLIDKLTFAITTSSAGPFVMAGPYGAFMNIKPGSETFWINYSEYDSADLSLVRSVDPDLWNLDLPGTTGTLHIYDRINHGILRFSNAPAIGEIFLDRGQEDMNGVHIIRESLTDPDWGMGYLETDIDDASFEAAADQIWDEGLGMSLLWDKQILIEEFIQEVVRHIDAAVYVSRTTGKFVLKLIRKDYDEGLLITLDESNIDKVASPTRPSFGELLNSVTVNYWDKTTGKDASLTVTDTAMVQMQSQQIIGTTLQYPGFTSSRNATLAGQRDLRSLSSQPLSCTIYADQIAKDLNIGDAFKFTWSRWQAEDLVMRVTGIAFGDGRNNQVRINCRQDVFDTPTEPIMDGGSGTEWVDTATQASPATNRFIFEAPYYELVQRLGDSQVTSQLTTAPEIGFIMAAAVRPGSAINARVWTDDGSGFADVGNLDFCPTALLTSEITKLQTSVVVDNLIDADLVDLGTHFQIGDEICRVDSIDTTTGEMTIGRGVLDTVPAIHLAGSRLFFWDQYNGADATEYVDGEEVSVKILPSTGSDVLTLSEAPTDNLVLDQRAIRPYPPGDLRVEGLSYQDLQFVDGEINLTWTHRDRTQQTGGTIYDHTFGNIGPEAGTLYRVRGYIDGVLDHTEDDIAGTSAAWTPAGDGEILVEIHSKRDGLYSMQAPSHTVYYSGTSLRLTEDGEIRSFENGDLRVTED